jgi:hypothetical protein
MIRFNAVFSDGVELPVGYPEDTPMSVIVDKLKYRFFDGVQVVAVEIAQTSYGQPIIMTENLLEFDITS